MDSTAIEIPSFVSLSMTDLKELHERLHERLVAPSECLANTTVNGREWPAVKSVRRPAVRPAVRPTPTQTLKAALEAALKTASGTIGCRIRALTTAVVVAAVLGPATLSNTDRQVRLATWSDMRFTSGEFDSSGNRSGRWAKSSMGATPTGEQLGIAHFLAQRYRVSPIHALEFVRLSFQTARDIDLDPWLILAVMSVESSLNPRAVSSVGAQGLMQVHVRVHSERFTAYGGLGNAFDPHANIRVGAGILREYIDRHGSVAAGLKAYVGAARLPDDGGYASKVLREYERVAAAAHGELVAELAGTTHAHEQHSNEHHSHA